MKNKGFTLIEMMIVVGIIGILAVLLLSSVRRVREKAVDTRRQTAIENVHGAITLYYSAKGKWPLVDDSTVNWGNLMTELAVNNNYLDEIIEEDDGNGDGIAIFSASACGDDSCVIQLTRKCQLVDADNCNSEGGASHVVNVK